MTTRKAVMWLGAASIASAAFTFIKRELHFIAMPGPAIMVALILGVAAIAAGWLGNRALTTAMAAGFLTAAATQVVTQTIGASIANGSNGSTAGLWLGLGAGLLAIGLTQDPSASGE